MKAGTKKFVRKEARKIARSIRAYRRENPKKTAKAVGEWLNECGVPHASGNKWDHRRTSNFISQWVLGTNSHRTRREKKKFTTPKVTAPRGLRLNSDLKSFISTVSKMNLESGDKLALIQLVAGA